MVYMYAHNAAPVKPKLWRNNIMSLLPAATTTITINANALRYDQYDSVLSMHNGFHSESHAANAIWTWASSLGTQIAYVPNQCLTIQLPHFFQSADQLRAYLMSSLQALPQGAKILAHMHRPFDVTVTHLVPTHGGGNHANVLFINPISQAEWEARSQPVPPPPAFHPPDLVRPNIEVEAIPHIAPENLNPLSLDEVNADDALDAAHAHSPFHAFVKEEDEDEVVATGSFPHSASRASRARAPRLKNVVYINPLAELLPAQRKRLDQHMVLVLRNWVEHTRQAIREWAHSIDPNAREKVDGRLRIVLPNSPQYTTEAGLRHALLTSLHLTPSGHNLLEHLQSDQFSIRRIPATHSNTALITFSQPISEDQWADHLQNTHAWGTEPDPNYHVGQPSPVAQTWSNAPASLPSTFEPLDLNAPEWTQPQHHLI
jgi:hypothetical protein